MTSKKENKTVKKWGMTTIISKNLYFALIQLMMYIVFIIGHICHLMNESKN